MMTVSARTDTQQAKIRTTLPELGENDAVLVVDMQQDFCPGGSLAVPNGNECVPVLNQWMKCANDGGALVVASRDWHPPGHVSFDEQGGEWPPHCIQGSDGARFHPDLQLPDDALIVTKGDKPSFDQYSAFDRTGLAGELRKRGVHRLWIGGLAQDVCVRAKVLDACNLGFETHLIVDATKPVNVSPDDGERALTEMREAGAMIEKRIANAHLDAEVSMHG